MSGEVLVSVAAEPRAAAYVAALRAAGIPAEAIRVVTPAEAIDELVAGAAGLVLCGGADVEPWRYGEEPLPGAGLDLLPRRDDTEWRLLAAARQWRLPVWGICRGFQVLNVFLGGSLWQDLPSQRPGPVAHDPELAPEVPAHAVRVLAPDAPLGERLAGAGPSPRVNSRHHQGIKRLGIGLLAVAEAADGLIEAAVLAGGPATGSAGGAGAVHRSSDVGSESCPDWWVRGVAWHPENLLELPEQLALWRDFAAAALGGSRRRDAGFLALREANAAPPRDLER